MKKYRLSYPESHCCGRWNYTLRSDGSICLHAELCHIRDEHGRQVVHAERAHILQITVDGRLSRAAQTCHHQKSHWVPLPARKAGHDPLHQTL